MKEAKKRDRCNKMEKEIRKRQSGITLIALVVTIIVLIILATVSINSVLNENGIIKKSEITKQEMKLLEYEERIKIIVLDKHTGKMTDETKKDSKLIDLVKERLEEEDWVGSVEYVNGEDNQLKVITKDGYILVIEVNEDGTTEIIEKGKDDGEPCPEIELTQIPLEGTENEKIKIKVVARVRTTEKTKKISKVRLVKPEEKAEEKEYEDEGVIFEVEGNGKYTFEAETNAGKISRKSIGISIVEPESDITISSEPVTARNTAVIGTQNGVATGAINVTINYGETSFQKLYKKDTDTDWTEVSGTSITFEVTENIAIYAKYYYGINSFNSVTYNIQNVDNVVPNEFNITTDNTTNSITVTAETEDTAADSQGNVAASGIEGVDRYEYRIYKGSTWQGWQEGSSFTGLTTGTYQVQAKAIDKAGNERISTNTESVTLRTISTDDISITATPTTARNTGTAGTQNGVAKGPISVTITYGNSSYTRQYKKETDTSWTTVSGTSTTFEVTENIAIHARYYDGTNGFQTQAYNIQNVDNVAPNTFNLSETHTTNSITVTASTTDTASSGASSTISGILRYEYRIYKNSAWQSWQTSNSFTGLTTGSYQVQAKAIDKAGNERISTNAPSVTLGTVSTADISITATPTTARNTGTAGTQNGVAKGPISVTITYGNSSYTRQYKKDTDTSWTTVSGTSVTFTVTENIAIYARYYDGTNGFQTSAYNIQNVDNVAPTFSSYNATVSGTKITATGAATDTASSGASSTIPGILRYEYSNGGSTYQPGNTFTVSSAGTYKIYIKAIDKAGNQTIVNKSVTVSSYTVTYNANGGSGAPSAQTAISGTNLTLSSTAPTRTGYTFLGWSTNSNATSATYAAGASYSGGTTTLYAVWKAKTITVTFMRNINSTDTTSSTQTFTYGVAGQSFSAKGWTKTGYTLLGWNENKTATEKHYNVTSGVSDTWINANSPSITIYGIWKANTYTVSYNANGGSGAPASQTKTYGVTLTLSSTIPTRDGYNFLGWSTDSTATSATYTAGGSYTANSAATLYAVWELIPSATLSVGVSGSPLKIEVNVDGTSVINSTWTNKTKELNIAPGSTVKITASSYTLATNTGPSGTGTVTSVLSSWSVTGVTYTGTSTITFTMPSSSVTVIANSTTKTSW